jgi:malate synthase
VFARLAEIKGIAKTDIRAMALVESHPLAFQMEEFIYNLRDHLMGLNLGRWDYMASLIHFNLRDPRWVLPDRNTIPHDVPFFQNLRVIIPEICHRRGILAIGGMTALYPSRVDAELNARALAILEKDKKNEADALMDGAWTGHPDQNEIAVAQFPYPNQLDKRPANVDTHPDLRPIPEGVGRRTIAGSRAAARVTTLYRRGVLSGRGASLIDGYMEDLATDRIYRLMLMQRLLHSGAVPLAGDNGGDVAQDRAELTRLYDEELAKLVAVNPEDPGLLTRARQASEEMILNGWHSPV